MPLGILNFAYGTGPYLRTTELAIAFNNELARAGHPRLSFIVPLVYGDRQKQVMREEFLLHEKKYPGELLLDARFGALLGSVFYGNNTYERALALWVESRQNIEEKIRRHLARRIRVETITGECTEVDGREIVIELNRSPRLLLAVAPSYSTTFGHTGEILERVLAAPLTEVSVSRALARKGVKAANAVEGVQTMTAVGYPATFSGYADHTPRFEREFLVPPISSQRPEENPRRVTPGILVTVTGIPGLERLYREARDLGFALYSNIPKDIPGSAPMLPTMITSAGVKLQFARSGWGSVWLSMVAGVPIVVPAFDPTDDPEIYFNNYAVERLGLGIIYRGQPLNEILAASETVVRKYAMMKKRILKRWGTLDGNVIAARRFTRDFLRRPH